MRLRKSDFEIATAELLAIVRENPGIRTSELSGTKCDPRLLYR